MNARAIVTSARISSVKADVKILVIAFPEHMLPRFAQEIVRTTIEPVHDT
ncbi:hypothetical protein WME79_20990 [Sorangium sp. So ce726]